MNRKPWSKTSCFVGREKQILLNKLCVRNHSLGYNYIWTFSILSYLLCSRVKTVNSSQEKMYLVDLSTFCLKIIYVYNCTCHSTDVLLAIEVTGSLIWPFVKVFQPVFANGLFRSLLVLCLLSQWHSVVCLIVCLENKQREWRDHLPQYVFIGRHLLCPVTEGSTFAMAETYMPATIFRFPSVRFHVATDLGSSQVFNWTGKLINLGVRSFLIKVFLILAIN